MVRICGLSSLCYLGEATHFQRSVAQVSRGRGCRCRQHRMFHELLLGEHSREVEECLRLAVPKKVQVIFSQQAGEEFMIPGCRGVMCGLVGQSQRPKHGRGLPLQSNARARIERLELEPGELREERMHAEPVSVPQPFDEQVRALKLDQLQRRIRAIEHHITELGSEAAQNGARRRNARLSSSRLRMTSWLR